MGVFQSVIQYAASRTPKKYRVPVTTGPQGQLDYGWVRGWDDLKIPPTSTKRGSNDLPHYDYTNLGLLFPENDASEKVYFTLIFPHGYIIGTDIFPHVHFIQDVSNLPTFKMDYRWYDQGESPPAFTTISTNGSTVFSYSSGSIAQVLEFPSINGGTISEVASIMDVIFYRDDANVAGDVLFKEFDIHIELNSIGSFQEYSK